ncbi:MAG: hypothetical protein QNJ07_09300 [Woeseiaceae bacterium]|nr:hypothetical protein [Woeseiaceae bacterium]
MLARTKVVARSADNVFMKELLTNRIGDTIRIERPPPKVFTDPIGHNIWMSGVEPCGLELESQPDTDTNPYDRFGSKVM